MTISAKKLNKPAAANIAKNIKKKNHLKVVPPPAAKKTAPAKKAEKAAPAKTAEKKVVNLTVNPRTFMRKEDAQHLANLEIKTYEVTDEQGMPYVIEAGEFVTNWVEKDAARKLAMALGAFVTKRCAAAVKAALAEQAADDDA
jgi:hypothetical protein